MGKIAIVRIEPCSALRELQLTTETSDGRTREQRRQRARELRDEMELAHEFRGAGPAGDSEDDPRIAIAEQNDAQTRAPAESAFRLLRW